MQVPLEKCRLRQNSTFVLVDEKQKKFNFLVPKESFGNEEIMNVLLPDFAARGFSGKIYNNFNNDFDDEFQGGVDYTTGLFGFITNDRYNIRRSENSQVV